MARWTLLILLVGVVAATSNPWICQNRFNIILPKVLVPGQSSSALVHFHNEAEEHNVTLRLIRSQDSHRTEILAQNTVTIKGDGSIPLSTPIQENGIYEIHALLDCAAADQNCAIQTSAKVILAGPIRDVIIRPSSNYYRPGETIVFWILAIDQLLHTPSSSLANLYVKDARDISQAVWQDVPLFEGTKEFRLPISARAALGKWTIQVRTEGNLYSSELNVSLARGSNQAPNREQVVAEKHFVELRFSDKMRRKYKPGLPLIGKVEAVSSEEEVRVRVKVIDDQLTILYSQDIDMSGREGTFMVPAVITNTSQITVQAELISLGGKDVDSRYVLARETLRKWSSESNCYLMIKNLQADLKPDEETEVTVLTSCPRSSDMHFVVSAEGKMVSKGKLTLTNKTNVPVNYDRIMQGVNIYQFNISLRIEAEMAPTSYLLVYYTSDTGEIIGDSIRFNVGLQHEKVRLISDENNVWYVDEKIKVGISSFPKTQVCLVGYREDNIPFWNRQEKYLDEQALYEDLTVLTSCKTKESNFRRPQHLSYFSSEALNQVWIWKCFNYTEDIEANGVVLPATPAAGKWNLRALSISDTAELRISDPVSVHVFSPVNVHFELPSTVKVMEIVQVEITILNNMNSCIDIHAMIALSEGTIYPGIDMSIVSEKLRLGGHGATSIVVRAQPINAGIKTMTANVTCFVHEDCDENSTGDDRAISTTAISNVITRAEKLEAVPEGIEKVHTESAYFCANEEILTLESRSVRYSFIPAPRKMYNLIFDVMAADNFHIALAETENSTKNIYQIYLGDFDNSVSWIGRGKHNYEVHLVSAQTADILSAAKYQTFWLSWQNSVIKIGTGSIIGRDTFLTHLMDKKVKVNLIGFATNFGVAGRVRISKYNDESGYSQVLRLDVPHRVVSASEKGNLYVTSGLSLPFVLRYLKPQPSAYPFSSLSSTLSSLNSVFLMEEMMWDSKWLQREFNGSDIHSLTQTNIQNLILFMNKDFSFGEYENSSDYLSTLKAYEILTRAQFSWKVDPVVLSGIKNWILTKQRDDGHFENETDLPTDDKLTITALTVAALLSTGFDDMDETAIKNGQRFLEANVDNTNTTFTLAAIGYTLTLLKSDKVEVLLNRLHIRMTTEDNDNEWQNSQSSSISSPFDWLYDKEKRMTDGQKKNLISDLIAEYEASLYAASIHILRKDLEKAEPIIKYIFYKSSMLDKHPEVSYLVTKTLVNFASVVRNVHPSLTVSLATSGMELTDTLELRNENDQNILDLPSLPTKVFIYATGAGCSTVQSKVTYLTYDTESAYSFEFITFIEEEIPAHYNIVGDPEGLYPQLIMKSCFRLENYSKGFRMEGILFSGYKLDSILSISPANINLKTGFTNEKMWFVFSNVSANCGICVRYLVQSSFIISSLRPMYFRMYEMENPEIVQELFVHSTYKESLLRTDTTDAHFVTWFGSQTERTDLSGDLSRFQGCESQSSQRFGDSTLISSTTDKTMETDRMIVVDVDNYNKYQSKTTLSLPESSTIDHLPISTANNALFSTTPPPLIPASPPPFATFQPARPLHSVSFTPTAATQSPPNFTAPITKSKSKHKLADTTPKKFSKTATKTSAEKNSTKSIGKIGRRNTDGRTTSTNFAAVSASPFLPSTSSKSDFNSIQSTSVPNTMTSLPELNTTEKIVPSGSTSSASWGILKEVAYDTRRAATLS